MGWWTGKPKTPRGGKPKKQRQPVQHRYCRGTGRITRFGLAPGGQNVQVGTNPCPGCNGRGTL